MYVAGVYPLMPSVCADGGGAVIRCDVRELPLQGD